MLCDTILSSILPNGNDSVKPMVAPKTEIARYFTRYNERIFPSGIPIAFIMPICRNSSLSVKLIVKRKITTAIKISAMLTTSRTPAMTISKI